MSKAPDRPAVAMKTLRFSRIVKQEVGGLGKTISLMLEARVPVTYPAHQAVLSLVVDGNRLKLDLAPLPEPVVVLDHSSDVIEMAMPATDTEVYDTEAAIAAEMEKAPARAIEILMPGVVKPRTMKRQLLTAGVGSNRIIRPTEG